jgi:hypothetical protein
MNPLPLPRPASPLTSGVRLLLLAAFLGSAASAQTTLCVKEITSAPAINGVVADGVAAGGCSADAAWARVSPAALSPQNSVPEAQLYLAHRPSTNRLYIGVTVAGDDELSEFDHVLLYFDADNSNSWNDGDFALQIQVSTADGTGADPLINSGTQCNVAVGAITYWRYDAAATGSAFDTFWKNDVPAAAASVQAAVAYDYTSTTGDDLEDEIWNLEIEIPTTGPHFALTTTGPDYFAVGAIAFIDDGHQTGPQLGDVRAWPAALHDPAVSVNSTNPNAVDNAVVGSTFPAASALATAAMDDVCFDVSFANANPWRINGLDAESGDHRVNRGANTFTVTFQYDGPDGSTPPLPNDGTVELAMKPYGNLPAGQTSSSLRCSVEQEVTATNVNGTHSVEFAVNLNDCAGWPNAGSLDFICVDLILKDFQRDDNASNNVRNINHNFFATSSYAQSVFLSAEGIPGLAPGEETTLLLNARMNNEPPRGRRMRQGEAPGWPALRPPTPAGWVLLFGVALLLALLVATVRHAAPVPLRRVLAVGVLAGVVTVAACRPPVIGDGPGTQPPPRWSFANAAELGIEPVRGEPGWFTVPIREGELLRLDLDFAGQPLPYRAEEMRLEPLTAEGAPNTLRIPVESGQVLSVFAFGEVDVDGPSGNALPVTADGAIRRTRTAQADRYLLTRGYHQPEEHVGALVGSFTGFDGSGFPIGRESTFIVPEGAQTLSLAVNAPLQTYAQMAGAFDLRVIRQPPVKVPTFGTIRGDATFDAPRSLPVWDALTSLSLYTYYDVPTVVDDRVVAVTRQPVGFSHYAVYASHTP